MRKGSSAVLTQKKGDQMGRNGQKMPADRKSKPMGKGTCPKGGTGHNY